jgi:N-acetylmuramoyl-L-alanine amidase
MLDEKEVIARTVWGEVRGQSPRSWAAVAHVIRNRVIQPGHKWWGDTFRNVCLKPYQFSCWLTSDPNYRQIVELPADDALLSKIRLIVDGVLLGTVPDPTGGATMYYNPAIVLRAPKWAVANKPCAVIDGQAFYALTCAGTPIVFPKDQAFDLSRPLRPSADVLPFPTRPPGDPA